MAKRTKPGPCPLLGQPHKNQLARIKTLATMGGI